MDNKREKELIKNTGIVLVGNVLSKGLSYLIVPILTYRLTTEEYGVYELILTTINLALPLIGIQLDQGVFRFLLDARGNKEKISKTISSVLFPMFIFMVILSGIFLAIPIPTSNSFKAIIMVTTITNVVSTFFMQTARGIGKNMDYSLSGIIGAILTFILSLGALYLFDLGVNGLLLSAAIGYLATILFLLLKSKLIKYISTRNVSCAIFKKVLKYSLPMVPNSMSWWIFSSSDRYIVSWIINISTVGILSIAYKFSNLVVLIFSIFNISLTESISLHLKDKDGESYFNKIFNTVSCLFISGNFIFMMLIPFIFNFVINDNYDDAYNLIPIAILASSVQVLVGLAGTVYIAIGKTKSVAITSIISAVVNIVVNLCLIHFVGSFAAVISTLVSFIYLFLHRYFEIRKKFFKISINRKTISCFIVNLILLPIYYTRCTVLLCLGLIIAIIFAIILNKEMFKKVRLILKGKKYGKL